MKSDFGINDKLNRPDDIDRLFELLDEETPPPGYAFGATLESIRTGQLPVTPAAPKTRRAFPLMGLVTAAAVLVLVLTFGVFNANNLTVSQKQRFVAATVSPDDQGQLGIDAKINSAILAANPKPDRSLQRLLELDALSSSALVADGSIEPFKSDAKTLEHPSPANRHIF